ncbi:MAG: IS4 family transposase [Gallionella sp.]|nr:IS4 family transposase [Gallionella sp.]
MDETFENEDNDEAHLVEGELASIEQDWDVVTTMLPSDWQNKAKELGAVRRLRGFASTEAVLRVMLIHLADGCSLRETAVRARAGDLADVSDVALLKRLRGCGPWFQWMIQEMAANMSLSMAPNDFLADRPVRLIDGSVVCEPGATGSTWRLHYALNLRTLSCDEVHVTEAKEGESLTRFSIHAGDVIMADRGFTNRRGVRHVVHHSADVVLRMNLTNLPLEDPQGQPLALLPLLRTLAIGQAADWAAWMRDDEGVIAVRVCAYKKTLAQTLAAQEAIQREATKKHREVKPETIEAAGYVIVLTTLMSPSAETIMEFYRRRWQVELAFKRLKSLLQLGHLKKIDKDGAKAWLQGKILVACLIETLILTAERFSPWGYPRDVRGISAPALALA